MSPKRAVEHSVEVYPFRYGERKSPCFPTGDTGSINRMAEARAGQEAAFAPESLYSGPSIPYTTTWQPDQRRRSAVDMLGGGSLNGEKKKKKKHGRSLLRVRYRTALSGR